jgi:hypothetical protein
MSSVSTSPLAAHDDVFIGDSEMARLMRAHDWAATPLGPVSGWAQSLKQVAYQELGFRQMTEHQRRYVVRWLRETLVGRGGISGLLPELKRWFYAHQILPIAHCRSRAQTLHCRGCPRPQGAVAQGRDECLRALALDRVGRRDHRRARRRHPAADLAAGGAAQTVHRADEPLLREARVLARQCVPRLPAPPSLAHRSPSDGRRRLGQELHRRQLVWWLRFEHTDDAHQVAHLHLQ